MKKILISLIALFVISCAHEQKPNYVDQTMYAVNWVQTSGEWQALSYQAFNLARARLDMDLIKNKGGKKRAIVVDIDETILDNSPFAARGLQDGTSFPVGWFEWTAEAKAKAMPGAIEFLQYAEKKGVKVFYITNREEKEFDATMKNLTDLKLPASKETLMVKTTSSNKDDRRNAVLKDYRVVMYMGDNLTDFPGDFDKKITKDAAGRVVQTQKHINKFGTEWIVLPNPAYGDWEGGIYSFDYSLTPEQKDQKRRAALRTDR